MISGKVRFRVVLTMGS